MQLSELMTDNDRDAAYRQACVSGLSHRLIPVARLYLNALLGHVCIKVTLITSILFSMSQRFGRYCEHFQRGRCTNSNLLLQ